ncbi:rhodanese-like domain-containing protein [Denitromonas iodatirespirans]|uniref:Sulfurtransferase n=1 Tax=Denitromonas iodatirespirans TaxID=2795389 RepID=A0A944HDT8_DENI1|nr:rhodanese-like domain-containing protein [Denitromonas iodatirespirans]MBT0962306.1 sulfurtransferase [Denitromonas iodatirespirans]
MRQMRPTELKDWLDDPAREAPVLLDVREPWEFELCHLDGSVLMPMSSVPVRLDELDPAAQTVVICHHGGRSMQVALFLAQRGFDQVINLAGGVAGWAAQVDPGMPQY